MKKVRKALLLVLALTVLFTTVAHAEETYLGQTESFYEEQVPAILESTFYGLESIDEITFKKNNSVGYMADAYEEYMSLFEGLGEFKESGDVSFSYDEETGRLSVICEATFENAKLETTVVCVLFGDDLNIESISFAQRDLQESTFGQKMVNAAMNTLIGVCVVFVVLIFISFLIYLLGFVPKLVEGKGKKTEAPAAAVATETVPVLEEATDDTELIAVIAAAIAASEGTSTDGFVVRSIRKRR